MAAVTLTWQGAAVKAALTRDMKRAAEATLADAVAQAQQPGYTPVDTGRLRNDLTWEVTEHGDRIEGWFGAPSVEYALWQEIGTSRGVVGQHYLRRSADLIFPTLPRRFR